ncbi:MAG: PEP-CTERM sorting domain-containing protein [Planctomycetia bacterium]|nr:PEP-CTERM sorting domain-containing protein [Planctomycetia bacterium]
MASRTEKEWIMGRFMLAISMILGLAANGLAATVDVYQMASSSGAASGGFSNTTWGNSLGTIEAEAPVYFVGGSQKLYVNGGATEATFPNGTLYIGYQYASDTLSFSDSVGEFRVQSSLNANLVLGNASMYMAYNSATEEGTPYTLKGTLTIADNTTVALSANSQKKVWNISSAIGGGAGSTVNISTNEANTQIVLLNANNTFSGTWNLAPSTATSSKPTLLANAVNTLGTNSTVSISNSNGKVQSGAAQTIKNLTMTAGTYESQGNNLTVSGTTTLNGNASITATGGEQRLGTLNVTGTNNHLSVSDLYANSIVLSENSVLSIGKAIFRLGDCTISVADTAKFQLGYNADGTLSSDSSLFSISSTNNASPTINHFYLGNGSILTGSGGAKTLSGTLYVGGTGLLRAASNSNETNRTLTIASAISSESETAKGELYLISSNATDSKVRLTGNNANFLGDIYVGKSDWSGGSRTIAEVVGNDTLGRGNVSVLTGSQLTSFGNQELQSLTLEANTLLAIQSGKWNITDTFTDATSSQIKLQLSNLDTNSLVLPDSAKLTGTIYLDSDETLDIQKIYPFLFTTDQDFTNFVLSETLLNAGFTVSYVDNAFQLRNPAGVPEPSTWGLLLMGLGWLSFRIYRKR